MRKILLVLTVLAVGCAHQARMQRFDNLEYRVVGRGEPVLLIHGALVANAFNPLLSQRALDGYQLISYHRRGFAGSSRVRAPFTIADQAADALGLLDHLGIRRAHVAGHSYGGDIALQLAVDHPERIASLILLEPALFPQTPALQAMGAEIGAAAQLHAKGDDRAAVQRFVQIVAPGPPSEMDDSLGAGTFDLAVTDAPTFFDVEAPALGAWAFTIDKAKDIRVPTLLMVGADSRQPFKESIAGLRQAMPNSEDIVIPGVGHMLQVAKPQPVAEAMAAFLRKHPIR